MQILLIPTAKLISDEMSKQFGKIPTALYPLGKKTILELICQKYENNVDKIYVIGYEKIEMLEDFVHWKNLKVDIIELDCIKDLGYSIQYGIQKIFAENSNISVLHINYADTLLDDLDIKDNLDKAYYQNAPLSNIWTFFQQKNGSIYAIQDKKSDILDDTMKLQSFFTGVFSICNPRLFLSCLEDAQECFRNMDSIYHALLKYSQQRPLEFCLTKEWLDIGHTENYLRAKTNVEAREFNTIKLDENRGVLKKTSRDINKFLGEIAWYIKMPQSLQYLLPRIYSYSLEYSKPYIEMEYYGYNTLHELLIYGNIPLIQWQHIFCKLFYAIEDMQRFRVKANETELENAAYDMYVNKTINRLNKLQSNPLFKEFFCKSIYINGEQYPSLSEIINSLPIIYKKFAYTKFTDGFSIIHGDLCFANILIEEKFHFIRLIDPRGSFGDFDIYGDPRYEIAKIMHSLEGHYDYIIEDMFQLNIKGNNLEYIVPDKTDALFDLFCETFTKYTDNIQSLRFIEAMLFLSMVPLHSDHLNRQYAMLATGLQLLRKIQEEENL